MSPLHQILLADPTNVQGVFTSFMTTILPTLIPQIMQVFMQNVKNGHYSEYFQGAPVDIAGMTQSTASGGSGPQVKKFRKISSLDMYKKLRSKEIRAINPSISFIDMSKQMNAEFKMLNQQQLDVIE